MLLCPTKSPVVALAAALGLGAVAQPPQAWAEESAPSRESALRSPPEGFVELTGAVPGLRLDIRYHTAANFTGAPVPGYGAPGAWLREEPAWALARVQRSLAEKGLGLVVYDAYRPVRGTLAMVAWAERTGQSKLVSGGYIARRSGHNHGHTVDLGLVELDSGKPLDMGTDFDTLSAKSHTLAAEGVALENRLTLKRAMEKQGFRNYSREWWHFSFRMKGTRPRDVPYGCFESDEGRWLPPQGWERPGYQMPMKWNAAPCPVR